MESTPPEPMSMSKPIEDVKDGKTSVLLLLLVVEVVEALLSIELILG